MRFSMFLFILSCQLIVVSGALAQDGGADSGTLESIDPLAVCMRDCSARNEMCVTTTAVPDCIRSVRSCASMAPRSAEIIAAFCTACGRAAVGCDDDQPSETTSVTSTAPPTAAPPPTVPAPRARVRPPTAEERERRDTERARGICRRQRGIWNSATAILMPDGTLRLGVCRTPEGAELLQMIEKEQEARAEGDRAVDASIARLDSFANERFFMQMDHLNQIQADLEVQNARMRCLELGAERIEYDTRSPVRHSEVEITDQGRWVQEGTRHVVYDCPGNGRSAIEPVGTSTRLRPPASNR